jgi:glycosyltransferase involved in cell wall biosynthesis
MAKKIIFIAPKTSTVLNFRGKLMNDVYKKGYEVVAIVPEEGYDDEFKKLGVRNIVLNFNKSSLSPFSSLKYLLGLKKIIKDEKPDVVFSYAMKPVIFGSIAAHRAKVKEIYSLVCGLGYVYAVDSFKTKILRLICGILYKIAFKYNKKVMFQNIDDINEFSKMKYLKKEKCELVNGSGVDLNKFKKNVLPNNNSFIMVSRIIKEKGVREYFEAASIIKEKYPDAKFTYIGMYDKSYARDFLELKKYIDKGIVEYIPETNKVADYVSKHAIFVLPSYYREGIPKTLLEASAMARPIITTNTPGCRETVIDGINGYFVNPKDVNDLAEKMEKMINSTNLQQMGNESYKICLEKFDIKIINDKMMEIMEI